MQRSSLSVQLRFCPSSAARVHKTQFPAADMRTKYLCRPAVSHEQRQSSSAIQSRFLRVAKLQKVTSTNPGIFQQTRAANHGRKLNPLSIAFNTACDPDSTPIHTSAHPAVLRCWTVCSLIKSARDCILNGTAASLFVTSCGKLLHPVVIQCEDIIAEPDMIDSGFLLEQSHLLSDSSGRTQMKFIARDWFRAPVA